MQYLLLTFLSCVDQNGIFLFLAVFVCIFPMISFKKDIKIKQGEFINIFFLIILHVVNGDPLI